jgi:hypothetical protein
MNKKDIHSLCIILASWEFRQGGSQSEAAALSGCISELRETFDITDEQLSAYRALEICRHVGDDSDELFDAVCDMIDDDYQGLLDAIDDARGFHIVKELAAKMDTGFKL